MPRLLFDAGSERRGGGEGVAGDKIASKFHFVLISLQGINLVAASHTKKAKHIAPSSEDIYLKLIVKVLLVQDRSASDFSLLLVNLFFGHDEYVSIFPVICSTIADWEQVQHHDPEVALYEQDQQALHSL